ncbi:MAG: anthranilate synthase component I family protein [Actinobacteria bacterium]|nr:anthranilate synthase component I family protein [Actinomycetota bacterium]
MTGTRAGPPPLAVVGGRLCTDLIDVTDDLGALDSSGFWAVVIPFTGAPVLARFATVRPAAPWPGAPWRGPGRGDWRSSLDHGGFSSGVDAVKERIRDGEVYQVNLTRRLSAALHRSAPDGSSATGRARDAGHGAGDGTAHDVAALGAALATGNPAPFSAVVRLPHQGVHVASASPERFLARRGRHVWSSPIKGTAPTEAALLAKDTAENVMIVDLVRNDLGRVCDWGTVEVPSLLAVEDHPGLVHLVSTVSGRLRAGIGWPELLAATFPPGSVTGAPKLAALDLIAQLEPVPRGVYCGAVGWVDADRRQGDLNVAIRTFWIEDEALHFGTGGGITIDSDPDGEWHETELKAANLLRVASGMRADQPVGSGSRR